MHNGTRNLQESSGHSPDADIPTMLRLEETAKRGQSLVSTERSQDIPEDNNEDEYSTIGEGKEEREEDESKSQENDDLNNAIGSEEGLTKEYLLEGELEKEDGKISEGEIDDEEKERSSHGKADAKCDTPTEETEQGVTQSNDVTVNHNAMEGGDKSKDYNKEQTDINIRTDKPSKQDGISAGSMKYALSEHQQETSKEARTIAPAMDVHDIEVDKATVEMVCSHWEVNIDDFWQDNPDWEPTYENDTHTCFTPVQDPEKAAFLRRLHQHQFPANKSEACAKVAVSHLGEYGFGSNFMIVLVNDFFAYFYENRPFQITRPSAAYRWLYVPPISNDATANNSWAACPSQDNFCYFLPISSCEVEPGRKHAPTNRKRPKKKLRIIWERKTNESETLKREHLWMSGYMMRPRQETRRQLYKYIQSEGPQLSTAPDCTWIHVRRGDAMTESGMFRNFYPIELYLKRGGIRNDGGDILLLTDDEAAIEEALLLHPEYKWKYFRKTRNRGVQKMHSHFPTKDEALEVLTILAEMQVASQCRKAVFGTSKYPKLIQMAMTWKHRKEDIKEIIVDQGIRKNVEDAGKFMEELEAKLQRARNASLAKATG